MLRKFSAVVAGAVVLVAGAAAQADITGENMWSGSVGAIQCTSWGMSPGSGPGPYTLSMVGTQMAPGSILGTITTTGGYDPTVILQNTITNDTDETWTDYHVVVTLNTSFTISDAGVSLPTGWTSDITAPMPSAGTYTGYVDYYSDPNDPTTDVPNGGELEFSYTIQFSGSVSFTEIDTPSVPEPASFSILGMLAVAGLGRRRRHH